MQLMDNSFSMVIQHLGTVVLSVKRIRFDLFFISLSYKKVLYVLFRTKFPKIKKNHGKTIACKMIICYSIKKRCSLSVYIYKCSECSAI